MSCSDWGGGLLLSTGWEEGHCWSIAIGPIMVFAATKHEAAATHAAPRTEDGGDAS